MLKIFSFLRLTEADMGEIAEARKTLVAAISPQKTKEKAQLLSVNKVTRLVERVTKKIIDYKTEQALGRIRWLKFVNELRWALHDAGYSEEFVALVAEAVIAKSVVAAKQARQAQ